MIISDFYTKKQLNIAVLETIDDPLLIESELDANGIYDNLDWGVSLITGDDLYVTKLNDLSLIPSLAKADCTKISGQTSIVELGRARYLVLFVDTPLGSEEISAEANIIGRF